MPINIPEKFVMRCFALIAYLYTAQIIKKKKHKDAIIS